jgi:hypothetical protein
LLSVKPKVLNVIQYCSYIDLRLCTEKYIYDDAIVHIVSYALHASFVVNNHTYMYIYTCQDDEDMSFVTFVRRSLYPWGNNASKDEGH